MCQHCWIGDHGMPVTADETTLAAAYLIEHLYEDLGQDTGGPLHWMLDDGNLSDDQLGDRDPIGYWHGLFDYLHDGTYNRHMQAGQEASPGELLEIQHTCEAILIAFRGMTENARMAACAWAFGWVAAEMPEWASRRRGPMERALAAADAVELLAQARALPPVEERHKPTEAKVCAPIPCPPFIDRAAAFRPVVTGIIHPGPGMVFAPDAKITGPFESAHANPDGSATVTGMPLLGNAPGGSPLFGWSSTVTMYSDGSVETSTWTAEDVLRASGEGFRASVADALAVPPVPRYVGDDADREG
jgi:hypothetical protein